MLVLSRQANETVMLGDHRSVTVVRVRADKVTLEVEIHSNQGVTVTFHTLDRDQAMELGENWRVTIVDIREEKVRLGIEGPASEPVHRKEVYDAIRRENAAAAAYSCKLARVPLAVDQTIVIGHSLRLQLTDIDSSGARLLVRGDLVGGPEDGLRVDRPHELATNSTLKLGTRVAVGLAKFDGKNGHFIVDAPPHMKVSVE